MELIIYSIILNCIIVAFCIPAKFKHISKWCNPNKLNIIVMANEIVLVHHVKF